MRQLLLNRGHRNIAWVLAVALLAGCATKPSKPEGPGARIEDKSLSAGAGADTAGVKPGAVTGEDLSGQGEGLNAAEQGDLPREMRVHFAFDSDLLDAPNQAIARAHAEYMARHPNVRVRIEGNTDERGTRAYNLALGERRAMAVRDFLLANGVSADRIEVISFGAEKPLNPGHDEAAWAENRRGDFVYTRR